MTKTLVKLYLQYTLQSSRPNTKPTPTLPSKHRIEQWIRILLSLHARIYASPSFSLGLLCKWSLFQNSLRHPKLGRLAAPYKSKWGLTFSHPRHYLHSFEPAFFFSLSLTDRHRHSVAAIFLFLFFLHFSPFFPFFFLWSPMRLSSSPFPFII